MAPALTADLCAQAIIAACRVYGVDPLQVHKAPRQGRTALVAAAMAAWRICDIGPGAAARVFQIHANSLNRRAREPNARFERAVAAAWEAVDVDAPSAPISPAPPAPPTAVRPAPAPARAPAPVDHTATIRDALRRRQAVAVEVVGVADDKARLAGAAPRTCIWPLGDLRDGTLHSCGEPSVRGRVYCADHCKAAGMKQTPRPMAVVGRCARPFGERGDDD